MTHSHREIITTLEDSGIYDVYFAQGKLHFMNDWDEAEVRNTVRECYPDFDQADIVRVNEYDIVALDYQIP